LPRRSPQCRHRADTGNTAIVANVADAKLQQALEIPIDDFIRGRDSVFVLHADEVLLGFIARKMITFAGWPASPLKMRRVKTFPRDPVPPVISIRFPSRSLVHFHSIHFS
jgi:hypothetical protein